MAMPAVRADGYRLRDGKLTVPDAPGFGLELDTQALKLGWTVRQ
jgi:L-alanine-DL-glutamate epimerase-like enolase superfamily enzyme